MEVVKTNYNKTDKWSHTDLAYIRQDQALEGFYDFKPVLSSFPEAIKRRKQFPVDRALLLACLKKQYERMGVALPVADEMILDENTFTITAAHQPTLLTGPIYHIYKIASAINLATQLQKAHPGQNFVPVFIVGGEDHDWEEINHLHLFGRKIEWQREAGGSCGRLSTDGLEDVIQEVLGLFSNAPHADAIREVLAHCLEKADRYGTFHQLLIQKLFGHHGLVVLNMDDEDLKSAFIPIMEKEIKEQFSFPLVTGSQKQLAKQGFKPQAFCRDINLFHMSDGQRERLEKEGDVIVKVESDQRCSEKELLDELQRFPDRFSPNVILRPLYQETILPDVAFIGGGGEIAYWLERKKQFEAVGVFFPMLVRRNSFFILDQAAQKAMEHTGLSWEAFMSEYDSIVKDYLSEHSKAELEVNVELGMLKAAYKSLEEKAELIDPTLSKAIQAEETRHLKQFEQLGSRLLRAEKQQQETSLKRIRKVKDKLFPEEGLQERYENFLPYYSMLGDAFITSVIDASDPMESKLTMLIL